MKKLICLALAASMLFSLCACGQSTAGAGDAPTAADAASAETAEADNADSAAGTDPDAALDDALDEDLDTIEALGNIEADKGLFDVTLTIPADFVGEGTTQESLDEEAKETGWKSATLNADGSVTYVITKAQHEEMMDGVRETIDSAIAEMVGSEDYPTITAIDANEDYTQFEVTLSTDELGLSESLSTLAFYMYGGMYHIFNGTKTDNISVQFIDGATGEVIEEANSADMAADAGTAG